MSQLFSPIALRDVTLKNRLVVPPMHQYAGSDGHVTDWTMMNAGRFAAGGAGLMFVESTKVERRGCGTVGDLGLWDDRFVPGHAKLTEFIRSCGSVPGIQLSHCGRKAKRARPWEGGGPLTSTEADDPQWTPVAPSPIAQGAGWDVPQELGSQDIEQLITAWIDAAKRADRAGYEVIGIQACHGYLLHQFLSEESNSRTDAYGGSFENRARLLVEILEGIRAALPDGKPIFVRLSIVDDAGWTIEDSVKLTKLLYAAGADVIDCSSGGIGARKAGEKPGPGYQVPYASQIKSETGGQTMAVGMIYDPALAESIVQNRQADLVAVGRALLANPQWPLFAAQSLGADDPLGLVPPAQSYWLRGWAAQG
jgi:2,4-dienoyl-CoA reductase-like NADH-dependent reductase (Old Yellow Enzyme family)